MVLIQNFDESICAKIDCDLLWVKNSIAVCYGVPETCKYNNKNGYPKEVKNEI